MATYTYTTSALEDAALAADLAAQKPPFAATPPWTDLPSLVNYLFQQALAHRVAAYQKSTVEPSLPDKFSKAPAAARQAVLTALNLPIGSLDGATQLKILTKMGPDLFASLSPADQTTVLQKLGL